MSDRSNPWEPDPNKLGNWQAMFEQRRGAGTPPPVQPAPVAADAYDDADLPNIDLAEYKPWLLQRGRSRPALMLALRRYETRAGLWHGWAMAYPSLQAVEYLGDRMVNLDFGTRQFVLEGTGLDLLARYLQQGSVLKIIEYAQPIWASRAEGPVISAIRLVGKDHAPPP